MAGAAALGPAVVFVCGVGWLVLYTGSVSSAVAAGVLPFVLGEPLKIGAAVSAVCAVRALGGRRIARGQT
jgi:biotin transport system substrate-specific component